MQIPTMKKIAASALLTLALTSCASSALVANEANGIHEPHSKQVTMIESTNTDEITVRASGFGQSVKDAIIDSRRAALWYALYGSQNPLLGDSKSRKAFKPLANDIYDDTLTYISYESGLKSKRKGKGGVKIDQVYRINVKRLQNFLVDNEIIVEVDAMSDELGMPSIAIVLDSDTTNKTGATQIGKDAVSEYFQNEDFDVTVPDTEDSVDGMLKKAMQVTGNADPMYLLAMSSGADIYVVLNVDVTTKEKYGNTMRKASVSLKAYYTATSKQLAVSTGYSPERATTSNGAIIQEATNDAASRVIAQIKKSWKKQLKKGHMFKILVTTSKSMKAKKPFHKAIKNTCNKVKKLRGTNTTFDYVAYCDAEDVMELQEQLQDNYAGKGQIFSALESGSMIMLKIAASEDDEFEIE